MNRATQQHEQVNSQFTRKLSHLTLINNSAGQ